MCVIYKDRDGGGQLVHSPQQTPSRGFLQSGVCRQAWAERPEEEEEEKKSQHCRCLFLTGALRLSTSTSAFYPFVPELLLLEPLSCTVHVAVASLWCGGTWSLCSDFSVSLGVDWGKDVEPSSPFSDQNKKAFSCYLDKIMTNETHNEISNYHEGSSPVSWHFRAWVPGTTRISLSLKMSIGKVEN